MKELISQPIGGDGGAISLGTDEQFLVVQAKYPKAKLLADFKAKFVDKLKLAIPGTWDDAIIEKAYQDAVAGL